LDLFSELHQVYVKHNDLELFIAGFSAGSRNFTELRVK